MNYGIVRGEPIKEYHAADVVSATKLEDFINATGYGPRYRPAYYYKRHIARTIPYKQSDALDLGQAAHSLLLEGEKALAERFIVNTKFDSWRTNESKKWLADCAAVGLTVLEPDERVKADRMAESMAGNPDAAALLNIGIGEQEIVFRRKLKYFSIQCRADQWMNRQSCPITLPSDPTRQIARAIVDLKSCASIERFVRNFEGYGYHRAAAFYRECERQVLADLQGITADEVPYADHFFVAIETDEPFDCLVYQVDDETMAAAQREVVVDLRELRKYYESGSWANPITGIQKLKLSDWSLRRSLDNTSGL